MSFTKSFEHSEKLFQAAIGEFASEGYEQASINTILKKAGMSKGQFYYHFENKQGLYFSLIEVLIARKKVFMASVFKPDDLQQDFFSILKTKIQYGVAFSEAHPEIGVFSESFIREKGNTIYDAALARFNFDNDAGLNQLIQRAYQNKEFRKDLPLPFIQKTISYLFTHAADLTSISSADDAEENLGYLLDFLKKGLANSEE